MDVCYINNYLFTMIKYSIQLLYIFAFLLASDQLLAQPPKTKPATIQKPGIEFPVAAQEVITDALPQPIVNLKDITVYSDIVYETISGFRSLRLDLYSRTVKSAAAPLVIFVHGGGFTKGNKRATANFENWPEVLAGLARKGCVVASVEYRLSSEVSFPAPLDDVKSALRFLRANSKKYGIDPQKVGIWGTDAGAQLAALVALTGGEDGIASSDKSNGQYSEAVQAWAGWYGTYDLSELIKGMSIQSSEGKPASSQSGIVVPLAFYNCTDKGCSPEIIKNASPISFVDEQDPSALLIHGKKDQLVPLSQTEAMEIRMGEKGEKVEVIYIDGVGHGWVGENLKSTQDASRRAVLATCDFFQRELGF